MKTNMKTHHALCGLISGLLLLAAGPDAGAGIIYSGPNQNVVYTKAIGHPVFSLFGAPGTWDDLRMNVGADDFGGGDTQFEFFSFLPAQGNYVRFANLDFFSVERFGAGATVDGSLFWNGYAYGEFSYYGTGNYEDDFGGFRNATGYAGMRLTDGPNVYYGWMHVSVTNYDNANITGTLIDWAYESTPNTAILTGATPAPVPEPGTALFGLACVGVAAFRRRRRA